MCQRHGQKSNTVYSRDLQTPLPHQKRIKPLVNPLTLEGAMKRWRCLLPKKMHFEQFELKKKTWAVAAWKRKLRSVYCHQWRLVGFIKLYTVFLWSSQFLEKKSFGTVVLLAHLYEFPVVYWSFLSFRFLFIPCFLSKCTIKPLGSWTPSRAPHIQNNLCTVFPLHMHINSSQFIYCGKKNKNNHCLSNKTC